MADFVKLFDGKKYMWDGKEVPSSLDATDVEARYVHAGFEARVVGEGGGFLVYTRRVAAEQAAAG
ncbi:MAG: hypothetical protein HZB91_07950 [Elusimicrobia bacterium]|nr:hypothetical protein [Elusimicrobiota bacterium]